MMAKNKLKVALAQMAPVWLNKKKTIEKIISFIELAGREKCRLTVFGEALLPGYPFWLEWTDGARFDSPLQKEWFAHYAGQAVRIESGDLKPICTAARKAGSAVVVGTIERPYDRGGHSLYCSLVYIDTKGQIQTVHRKLMPTYEERLVWSPGDGHGLRTHALESFTVGALNCWENWMPLARTALYGMGEDLHVAIWPGNKRNTVEITRYIAREARSYVISVSGLMKKEQIGADLPHADILMEKAPEVAADGGSCLAAPDGSWVIEPIVNQEGLFTAEIDHNRVLQERQNFDPSGHYARPDVLQLTVDRHRQTALRVDDRVQS